MMVNQYAKEFTIYGFHERKREGESRNGSARSNKQMNESNETSKRIQFIVSLSRD